MTYKKVLPLISCLFFLFLNNVIIPPQGYSLITPCLSLCSFIFWVLNKNIYLNNIQVFILGIFTDLLYGSPIASNALIYLITKSILIYLDNRYHYNNSYFNIIFLFDIINLKVKYL